MSFFNSVVSAVVGAVAAVANAVVSAAKSIVSAVSGKGSQDAGGMTALGAMATIADVFEDGEIDDDEEELLVEAFKLLVGAFIVSFGSGSSSAEIDSNENTCKNEPTLWSKTCNLGAGVLDGAKGTLDGLANMVKHQKLLVKLIRLVKNQKLLVKLRKLLKWSIILQVQFGIILL